MGQRMSSPETRALQQEILDLKKRLVEARRKLPQEVVPDFAFKMPCGADVSLNELFGDQDDLILIHNMGRGCVYCTLWADGLNGLVPHLEDRAALVLVSPDSPADLKSFSESRGWRFRCVSSEESDFAEAMGFWSEEEGYWPGASVFRRQGSVLTRVSSTEFGPGDEFCALWPLFDLLEGGAKGWEPQYEYR